MLYFAHGARAVARRAEYFESTAGTPTVVLEENQMHRLVDLIPAPKRDVIYDILQFLPLRLCVDIGAAAGHLSKRMLQAGNEGTRVVAFEPFPGNHPFFRKTMAGQDRAVLKASAVSDSVGTAVLVIGSVVTGSEPGWENFSGYSSVGYLASRPKSWIGMVRRAAVTLARGSRGPSRRPAEARLKVQTTTVDREFPTEVLDFVKIDVQGSEEKVLRGAKSALAAHRIGVLYVEWSGEAPVIEHLENAGYVIYDSTYLVIPVGGSAKSFEQLGFAKIQDVQLSTGRPAFEMIPGDANRSPVAMIAEAKRLKLGHIQTDLIAVSPAMHQPFLAAVGRYTATTAVSAPAAGARARAY